MGDRTQQALGLAAGLTILLIAVNTLVQPQFAAPQYIGGNLDLFAPLALAAVASTPSILAGGIDVSIGPLLGLVNILVVSPVLPLTLQGPLITPVVCLAVGAGVGIVNGLIVAMVRIQPVVATIGTYLILAGLDVKLLPTPAGPARLGGPTSGRDRADPGLPAGHGRARRRVGRPARNPVPRGASRGRRRWAGRLLDRNQYSGRESYRLWPRRPVCSDQRSRARLGLSAADATLGPQSAVVATPPWHLTARAWQMARGLTEAFLGALMIFLIRSLLAALGLTSLSLPLIAVRSWSPVSLSVRG